MLHSGEEDDGLYFELSLLVMVLHSDEDSDDCKELSLLVVIHSGRTAEMMAVRKAQPALGTSHCLVRKLF